MNSMNPKKPDNPFDDCEYMKVRVTDKYSVIVPVFPSHVSTEDDFEFPEDDLE